MSDCESIFDVDDCVEPHVGEGGAKAGGIMCGYEDEFGEMIAVGIVRDASGSRLLSKRRKKSTKKFCIPNVGSETARTVVRHLNGEEPDIACDVKALMELYQVAKVMEIDSLVDWIVCRFVDLFMETSNNQESAAFEFLGIRHAAEWEEECVWVYAYI